MRTVIATWRGKYRRERESVFRRLAALCLAAWLPASVQAQQDTREFDLLTDASAVPATQAFLQLGAGDRVGSVTAGLMQPWAWRREALGGTLGGYWELLLGAWHVRRSPTYAGDSYLTTGITPVVRLQGLPGHAAWFVEGGIGAHLILPRYRNGGRSFSTRFNFGDHVGIGRFFGSRQDMALSLRFQHFSNAGIDQPNPGEDFLQLRLAVRWR